MVLNEVTKFNDKLRELGWKSKPVDPDTGIQRGRKKSDSHLWAVLYSDPVVAGAYGSWKSGESYSWCSKSKENLTEEEREALQQQFKEAKAKREREANRKRARARQTAKYIEARCYPTPDDFPYLVKKQVKPHGVPSYKGSMAIPCCDVNGVLHGYQFIYSDGTKRFQSGLSPKGLFYLFGSINPDGVLYVAEGWATAATIYQWKKIPTIAAFNAGNLKPAGLALRRKYPNLTIIFAADSDRFNKQGNVGKEKAEDAARLVRGRVLLPEFPIGSKGTDWNDLWVENGGVLHE